MRERFCAMQSASTQNKIDSAFGAEQDGCKSQPSLFIFLPTRRTLVRRRGKENKFCIRNRLSITKSRFTHTRRTFVRRRFVKRLLHPNLTIIGAVVRRRGKENKFCIRNRQSLYPYYIIRNSLGKQFIVSDDYNRFAVRFFFYKLYKLFFHLLILSGKRLIKQQVSVIRFAKRTGKG